MPAMWPTCLIRKKRPSSSRRPLPTRRLISERQCGARGDRSLLSRRCADGRLNGLLRSDKSQFTYQSAAVYRPISKRSFRGIHQESDMDNKIGVESPDGTFQAYISRPASLPAPAVVVLQELFGVNADIRATCDELAGQGFIAVA